MTTTELINLLRQNEHGGASGRPREVYFEISDRCINTDGIEVTGSGDGLFAELYLSLPCADRKGKWKREVLGSTSGYGTTVMYQCSNCENMAISDYRFCPNCGARMVE